MIMSENCRPNGRDCPYLIYPKKRPSEFAGIKVAGLTGPDFWWKCSRYNSEPIRHLDSCILGGNREWQVRMHKRANIMAAARKRMKSSRPEH